MFTAPVHDSRNSSCKTAWFALRVRTNREKLVSATLRSKGYEEFLPAYICRRIWSDRIKQLERPLFPGYVFSRFDASDRLPILTIPGVLHIVGAGKVPAPVDEGELAAIETAVGSRLPLQPWPFLRAGDRVLIDWGPLRGLEGILLETRNDFRLVVSVSLLQRSVAIEIDREWVKPLARAAGASAPSAAWMRSAAG